MVVSKQSFCYPKFWYDSEHEHLSFKHNLPVDLLSPLRFALPETRCTLWELELQQFLLFSLPGSHAWQSEMEKVCGVCKRPNGTCSGRHVYSGQLPQAEQTNGGYRVISLQHLQAASLSSKHAFPSTANSNSLESNPNKNCKEVVIGTSTPHLHF